MRKEEQASLISALSYCSLRELPQSDDGHDYWLESLARVSYSNGSYGYVYVKRNDTTLEIEVKKTFGDVLGIGIILEYYPFEFLRGEFNPKFDKKEDKIKYLSELTVGKDKLYARMNNATLDEEIIRLGIKIQKEHDNKIAYNG